MVQTGSQFLDLMWKLLETKPIAGQFCLLLRKRFFAKIVEEFINKNMKRKYYFLISLLLLFFPVLIFADRGMVVWPPEIRLDQSAQNAIVAWNGREEIIILSSDIETSNNATVLEILPLPSNPSEIKEGSFDSFENLVDIINDKLKLGRILAPGEFAEKALQLPAGIEIVFQKEIGAHEVTVVKVNDLDYFLNWAKDFAKKKQLSEKQFSSDFKEGVKNYLKKDIKYFVFDVIEVGKEKESVKPLIYRFESNFLCYPLLISGISDIGESMGRVNLFLITDKNTYINYHSLNVSNRIVVELTKDELKKVSNDLAGFFEREVRVERVDIYSKLRDLNKDAMFFPSFLWNRNLTVTNRGNEVKALQQMLINEGLWESEVGATGYFGSITKSALVRFQEQHNSQILKPIGLKVGTGYFGSKSREYFQQYSLLEK